MRVFLAGATGVVGRPLCRRLRAAGHEIVALTRTERGAGALRELDATPVIADVFDEPALHAAVAQARPDAVIHQLTAIPARIRPRHAARDLAATNRLRTEGTRILVAAARAAGARRVVAQSISFLLAPDGPSPAAEEPVWRGVRGSEETHAGAASLEAQVTGAPDLVGIALRYGAFYGPGTVFAPGGSLHADVMRRRMPIIGAGDGVFSFLHVDDAAAATVAALDRGAAGVYNVVDDDPAPVRDWLPAYAAAVGAKPPRRIPRWLARLVAGPGAIYLMCQQRAISNGKARTELGWSPAISTWREGFRSLCSNP
jgi:nucleoside-diphosphate-sugar epimerase